MSENAKITHEELVGWFPIDVPLPIIKILFPEMSQPLTNDEIRSLCMAAAVAPRHVFTGGVGGADNCQHVENDVQCGRWSDEPETIQCKDR